jgi:hypothetical protein
VRLATIGADGKAGPARLLETSLAVTDRFGAAWLTDQVGLWNDQDGQSPELHGRRAAQPVIPIRLPATRPNDTRPRTVRSALGLDHALAVVTASGVELFDEAGRSTAGADPFDATCGRPGFLGGEAAALDGTTIAVGGTTRVSLFRWPLPLAR